jgi:hypothetical protein
MVKMPIAYRIDTAHKLIRTECVGYVTLAEVITHFRELEADPNCPPHADVLLDVTEEVTIPSSDELRNVALAIAGIRRKVEFRLCAIVASTNALFGMMRMFEVFTEKYFQETRAFRTLPEAEAWLASKRPASTGLTSTGA